MLDRDEEEPSIIDAMGRVVDAGQRVLVNRFDLLRLDVADVASRTLRSASVLVLGAAVLGIAWVAFSAALVVVLRDVVTLASSLALVGCANAVAGGLLVAIGTRRASVGRTEERPGRDAVRTEAVEHGEAA